MAEDDLFPLLNITDTEEIDCNAIISSIYRNPQLAAKKYYFDDNFGTFLAKYRAFPLHQAIKLRANIEVVEALYNCYPQAIKEKSSGDFVDGCTALHVALRNRAPVDVVLFVFHKWPEAAQEKESSGYFPFHDACDRSFPIEVVSLLLDAWPDALSEKGGQGKTSLHCACTNGVPVEVVSFLLDRWPSAVRERDLTGSTPFHCACFNGAPTEVLSLLLESCPDSVREKTRLGMTPLHLACYLMRLKEFSTDNVFLLLKKYPAAAREKDNDGNTPLHYAGHNHESLNVVLMLLEHFPEAVKKKNEDAETPLDVSKRFVCYSSDVEKVLSYVLQLCEGKMDNGTSTLREMIDFFTQIEWWNGIAMVLDRHPCLCKDLEIDLNILPQFLSVVRRRCMMKTMWYVISNELDIIEGA